MAGITENPTSEQDFNVDDSVVDAVANSLIEGIENCYNQYCIDNNIENMKTETQSVFTASLMYCYFTFIKPQKNILYKYKQGISNNNHVTMQYDFDLLGVLCDYYIYKSLSNGKVPSIQGFCYFLGISSDMPYEWAKQESQHPKATNIYKKLRKAYETGLEYGAQFGKNPVGFIATLNHRFGWSSDNKPTLTVNINRDSKQIMSTFDNSLTDNHS